MPFPPLLGTIIETMSVTASDHLQTPVVPCVFIERDERNKEIRIRPTWATVSVTTGLRVVTPIPVVLMPLEAVPTMLTGFILLGCLIAELIFQDELPMMQGAVDTSLWLLKK